MSPVICVWRRGRGGEARGPGGAKTAGAGAGAAGSGRLQQRGGTLGSTGRMVSLRGSSSGGLLKKLALHTTQ